MMEDAEQETNPYLALRAAKIARNQARLLELGLDTTLDSSNRRVSPMSRVGTLAVSRTKEVKGGSQSRVPSTPNAPRRSNRLSGQSVQPNYVEDPIHERRYPSSRRKRSLSEYDDKAGIDTQELETETGTKSKPKRLPLLSPSTSSISRAPPSPNSVRSISIHGNLLVQNFLGRPMVESGKQFVVYESYRVGAYQEDKDRLGGNPKLSFNKYSGVQEWKNVFFLWVNLVPIKYSDGLIRTANQFLQGGKLITWYGGSNMWEDSPIIQSLMKSGRDKTESKSSTIVLWCRQSIITDNRRSTSVMGPYMCLGRLEYDSHTRGSHPVALTWRLTDYDMLTGPTIDAETRELFQGIVECTM
jgi:hypothetical protein